MTRRARIRVLYCLDSFEIGGSELNAVRTAERLDFQRIELLVSTFRLDGPLRARYEALGVRIEHFPLPNLYGARALQQGVRFARFITDNGIDVVHAHDIYTNMFAIPWGRMTGRPGLLASRRWWSETPRESHKLANRLAYKFAHKVLANSPAIGTMLVEQEGVPRSRIVVVPNFVDDEAFEPPDEAWLRDLRARLKIPDSALVVGAVANLHPIKNYELLLAAAATLVGRWPTLHIVIVGEGQRRPELEALAAHLGLRERVVFAGLLPQYPSPHHLFDVSVLTSRGEGFPNSIIEAMAAGRPVVATAVGGVVDAFQDGVAGRMVPSGDREALANAIESYLRDPEARRAAGLAARREANERYHARRVLPLVHDLYVKLTSDRDR